MNNRRNMFFQFAKMNNFDPFVAENWYPVIRDDLVVIKVSLSPLPLPLSLDTLPRYSPFVVLLCLSTCIFMYLFVYSFFQGASTTLEYYNGSVSTALVHLFPDIGLDANKFDSLPSMPILLLTSFSLLSPSLPFPLLPSLL